MLAFVLCFGAVLFGKGFYIYVLSSSFSLSLWFNESAAVSQKHTTPELWSLRDKMRNKPEAPKLRRENLLSLSSTRPIRADIYTL